MALLRKQEQIRERQPVRHKAEKCRHFEGWMDYKEYVGKLLKAKPGRWVEGHGEDFIDN